MVESLSSRDREVDCCIIKELVGRVVIFGCLRGLGVLSDLLGHQKTLITLVEAHKITHLVHLIIMGFMRIDTRLLDSSPSENG